MDKSLRFSSWLFSSPIGKLKLCKTKGVLEIQLEDIYSQHKRYLMSIAYRMLGSLTDAEDITQEVFVRVASQDWNQISNIKTYLAKITVNSCINLLQSSSRRRELYLGPWLPEPMLDTASQQPEEAVERGESIRYALLVMLQTLSPQERALFILRDCLGYTYTEIAEMIDRTESHCRKIYSRAKQKMVPVAQEMREGWKEETVEIAKLFINAVETGEFHALIKQLLKDVTLITDGGGKTRAAYKPIYGADRVLAFLQGIQGKGAFDGKLIPVPLNSETGILLSRQQRTVMTICFALDSLTNRIKNIYIVMNPEKLHAFHDVDL